MQGKMNYRWKEWQTDRWKWKRVDERVSWVTGEMWIKGRPDGRWNEGQNEESQTIQKQ